MSERRYSIADVLDGLRSQAICKLLQIQTSGLDRLIPGVVDSLGKVRAFGGTRAPMMGIGCLRRSPLEPVTQFTEPGGSCATSSSAVEFQITDQPIAHP